MTAVPGPRGRALTSIVPCPPGWYARWQFGEHRTVSYPVVVWGLAQTPGEGQGKVVGVDAGGQWPGGDDERPGAAFVRYIFQPFDAGVPDDVFNPVQSPTDPK